MFETTVMAYISHLGHLRAILEKAHAWQTEKKISDETIMNARIALDQFPLAFQVRSVTTAAKNGAGVLCGVEYPVFEDTEKTIPELLTRIDTTVTFLKTLDSSMVKSAADLEAKVVPMAWMPGKGIAGKFYTEVYTISNFYFHYVTAYSILRHYGLEIGKGDYMGTVEFKDVVA
jgi:hypothetical protein